MKPDAEPGSDELSPVLTPIAQLTIVRRLAIGGRDSAHRPALFGTSKSPQARGSSPQALSALLVGRPYLVNLPSFKKVEPEEPEGWTPRSRLVDTSTHPWHSEPACVPPPDVAGRGTHGEAL